MPGGALPHQAALSFPPQGWSRPQEGAPASVPLCCDPTRLRPVMIRNMYLVFVPRSWTDLLVPLECPE